MTTIVTLTCGVCSGTRRTKWEERCYQCNGQGWVTVVGDADQPAAAPPSEDALEEMRQAYTQARGALDAVCRALGILDSDQRTADNLRSVSLDRIRNSRKAHNARYHHIRTSLEGALVLGNLVKAHDMACEGERESV